MLIMYMMFLRTMVKNCVSRFCVETGFHVMELRSFEAVCRQKVWKNRFSFLESGSHARSSGFLLGIMMIVNHVRMLVSDVTLCFSLAPILAKKGEK